MSVSEQVRNPDVYTSNRVPETSLLWQLAEFSDLLERKPNNIVAVKELIETPYNEHGIVDRKELFKRILGSVASDYHWEGHYNGPHHLMWPRTNYRQPNVPARHVDITAHFRGSPSLKVILPRQLHDYLHRITSQPIAPSLDVMQQYNLEQAQVGSLYGAIRLGSYAHANLSYDKKEKLRLDGLHRKLDVLPDGQLGLLPDRETLATAGLSGARTILRRRSRALGISGSRACQDVFFADDTY